MRNAANNMAIRGVSCLALVALFFHTFGDSFEVAANSGHFPS
jgi:hypothetical protein